MAHKAQSLQTNLKKKSPEKFSVTTIRLTVEELFSNPKKKKQKDFLGK
jgi:hypothetical protein